MSSKNTISRLYTRGVKLNSAINQSRVDNKKKQEIINKLATQNKMLREVLTLIRDEAKSFEGRTGNKVTWLEDANNVLEDK